MKPETFRFQVGSFLCIAIQDDAPRYPIGMFLTNLAKERYEPALLQRGEDPQHIDLPYTCLFISNGRERLLVDTGIGSDSLNPNHGRLLPLLRAEGIEPHEIGTVILSHGHPDHVGGNLNEAGQPAFPNARYVILRTEWDFWMSTPSLAELPVDESFKKGMLASAQKNLPGVQAQLDLVGPDSEIVSGITAVAAFGHSPGQMALEISSVEQRLLFVADAIVHPLHIEYPETVGNDGPAPKPNGGDQNEAAGECRKGKIACVHVSFRLSWAGTCSYRRENHGSGNRYQPRTHPES